MQFVITRGLTWDRYIYLIHKLSVNGYDPYDRDTFIITDWTSEGIDRDSYSRVDTLIDPDIDPGRPVILLTGRNDYTRNMARGIGAKRALAISLTRMYGHRFCIMMDDNISVVDMSRYQVSDTGTTVRYQIGSQGPYVGSPITPDVAEDMREAQGNATTFRHLSSLIMECPLWDDHEDLVVMGCTRVDHSGTERRTYVDPDVRCSGKWGMSIHKYLVMDVTRMRDTTFDPLLTVMGEDVILFGNLSYRGLKGYKLYNIMIHRDTGIDMYPLPEGYPLVTINADDFYYEYLSSPMLTDGSDVSPEDMVDILSGDDRPTLQYDNSFRVNSYLPRGVGIPPEFPVNPFIRARAISGVPMTSNSGLGTEGAHYRLRTTWTDQEGNYTACRHPCDDTWLRSQGIIPTEPVSEERLWYNFCLPSYMHLGDEGRYNERWRFLILYGMIRYATTYNGGTMDVPDLLADMFKYYYHQDIGISFILPGSQQLAEDNPNPNIRERCRPFLYPTDVGGMRITRSLRCTSI